MPSKSKKQAKFMRAVAHGWKPDRMKGPTIAVAKEFVNADRRKKVNGYQFGGMAGMMNRFQGQRGAFGGRDPRAMPPQGGGGALSQVRAQAQAQRGQVGMRNPRQRMMPPGRGPRGPVRPGMRGRGPGGRGALGQMQQQFQRQRGAFGGRDPRAMPPRAMPAVPPQRGGGKYGSLFPGKGPRPMVPPSPPRGYPGGGNPNVGGRNPIMRGARARIGGGGRGRTSLY